MKKVNPIPFIIGTVAAVLFFGLCFYLFCPALNVHNVGLWVIIDLTLVVFILTVRLTKGIRDLRIDTVRIPKNGKKKARTTKHIHFEVKPYILPITLGVLIALTAIIGTPMFNATLYSQILTVTEADFSKDLAESIGTDSIALMDTASAQMLGDREIGSLSHVVSQFDVSDDYTQIDLNGKPVKVSALDYAGFFKWFNNKDEGIKGYVTVDPVSMSAKFCESDGMKYVPSAYFGEDAYRHIRLKYPTLMLDNLHFETDEEGKPYYVVSVVERTIALFGGKTVSGCITLDPVTGETVRYAAEEVPQWIDVVFHGNLICTQYNWQGLYKNGFLNSIFAKKDCKQVTTYYSSEEEEESDDTPTSDYGYIAKDGDIWIYTGITSVNGDSSNIGFLLANERTGESRYYRVAGADEKSAMVAAEGEVQEKGYQASFPSLINVSGHPTYIMVLKDAGGLVKLYATVNVEQYNIVTTAPTQAECIEKYKAALGIEADVTGEDTLEAEITVAAVKYIDIDGNTYIYLIDTEDNIFKAKAADHEDMLLLGEGDRVIIKYSGNTVTECKKAG